MEIRVFLNMGDPQVTIVFNTKISELICLILDDLGVPPFEETSNIND